MFIFFNKFIKRIEKFLIIQSTKISEFSVQLVYKSEVENNLRNLLCVEKRNNSKLNLKKKCILRIEYDLLNRCGYYC